MIDAHEPDRQARRHFSRDSGLEQTDHSLLFLARPQQQNAGLLSFDCHLIGGDERESAPSQKRRAEKY